MQVSTSPDDPSLIAAARWLQSAMLGSVATAIAVIAVAGLGLLLLQGRLPVRRSATVITGCFLLFGAPILASGLQGGSAVVARAVAPSAAPPPPPLPAPLPMPAPTPLASTPPSSGYDPYAGASLIH